MSSRIYQIAGLAIVGGAGYYLYNAGGDPKAAEKRVEADAARLSSSIKHSLPGTGKEIQKEAEVKFADAGKKFDDLKRDAKQSISNVDAKLEGYRREAESKIDSTAKTVQAEGKKAVDSFDKNVSATAKSWFGSSK